MAAPGLDEILANLLAHVANVNVEQVGKRLVLLGKKVV